MTSFNDTRHPVARIEHRCEWCGQPIPIGEKHCKFVGVWQGNFQSWRMHNECYDDAITNGDVEEGFSPYEHDRPPREEP